MPAIPLAQVVSRHVVEPAFGIAAILESAMRELRLAETRADMLGAAPIERVHPEELVDAEIETAGTFHQQAFGTPTSSRTLRGPTPTPVGRPLALNPRNQAGQSLRANIFAPTLSS